jgi:hypothetical protein
MTTPNDDLTQRICAALKKDALATPLEIEKTAKKILAGKVKPEDWYALFENSLPKEVNGAENGN